MSHRETAIIKLLSEKGEMSSLGIVDSMTNDRFSYLTYPVLRHLTDSGQILRREGEEKKDSRGGRTSTYYRLPDQDPKPENT